MANNNKKLRGTSWNTVDAKGRLIIPKRFRERFAEYPGNADKPLMITYYDGALHVFPETEWEKKEEKILENHTMVGDYQMLIDNFLGQVSEGKIDKQWRVLIPAELRNQADIREEIVIVGLVWYFKIWNKDRYENQKAVFDKHVKSKEYQRVIQDMGL